MNVTESKLKLHGTSVFVRQRGEGRPVVLINGIGAHVDMWHPMEHALAGMRVVSFDAPGTGRSHTPLAASSIWELAELVEELFDRLGLDRADVLGYSFGGAVAQQFALQAPRRVRRLVLAATGPGWGGVPGQLTAMLSIGTPLRYYSRSFYERTASTVAGGPARWDLDYLRRLWRLRGRQAPTLRGYAQQLWAIGLWSSFPCLARIESPTLIVVGDDDPLVPVSNSMMMASRMPQARVIIGEGEGHFLLLDEHSPVFAPIKQFLVADDLDEAEVWLSAARFDEQQAREQLRSDGLGALPWGAFSALFREMCW